MATAKAPREPLNDLVLKVFRLNGRLLDAAERLTQGSGLTAARWQVLGAVLAQPLTVAAAARSMGLARQSVQRLADALVEEGLCQLVPNPAHQRAKLLAPTDAGWKAIAYIRPGVVAWAKQICDLVGENTVAKANTAIDKLLHALTSPEGQVPARQGAHPRQQRARR